MRYIQTELTETEFLRLKSYCIFTRQSLKTILREAIVAYLNNNQLSLSDENSKEILQHG